ncbi:serine/threonine-protein phosphatase 6 regulatory ankyrin repeat subunit B-like [Mytilus edulis]|uniref:serine/threonine-protein phosphatase 6 regulatory ankyrin repeat subunit B-like n=1 Tax=Mytilus edulis TaxID=6550 RepID=UPI0039F13421
MPASACKIPASDEQNVPDSKTFDVTLMITLLRNLASLNPPHGGYDKLPTAHEATPTSDLARIKYYRNFLAHLDDGKIDGSEFNTAWDDITGAVSRLGGQQMKEECDKLKVKILDQTNQEIMLDIKRSNGEIMELKQSVRSLMKVNEDLTVKMRKLKISKKDTVPWNIREQINQILMEWQENDKTFIITRAAKHVLKCIKENSSVTITASSGVGKTAILRHVALQMAKEEYDVLLVTDPGDIVKFYNPKQKTLFVIDDLCGNYSLNQTDMKVWEPVMERIKKFFSNKLSKIIVACRLQVYQDDKFDSLSVFKSCVCNLLSDTICLSKPEKQSIAELYLESKAHEITDSYDLFDCFPLLCNLYHKNPVLDVKEFFQNPFSVYEAEIDKLQKKEFCGKFCALALCVMFNNNLKEEFLTEDVNDETRTIFENTCEACRLNRGTSRLTLQDEMNSLLHTFLKKEQSIYKTIHDKLFDFLMYYFGKKIIQCFIKNGDSSLIQYRFLLEKQDNMNPFITIVPPKNHEMYIQRIIEDWLKGKVQESFFNINMKIPQFRQKLLCHIKKLDISYQRRLANTCDVTYNNTILIPVCSLGDISILNWCLNHGVDVNQCNNNGWSPVMSACRNGQIAIVKMLFDKGADYDKCDNNGWSPLMTASSRGKTEIVRILLDIGADYNKCSSDGWSPVTSACRNGRTEIVKMLLDKGVNYNKCHNEGWSPVTTACKFGHIEIVKMLLDKGVDYNKFDNNDWSPVMSACRDVQPEILRMLLDIGADNDKCSCEGWSPLMIACRYGHIEIVRILLDKGANYNKCGYNGGTPLGGACKYGHTEIVRMLLDKGADYKNCSLDGLSFINYLIVACTYGYDDIVRILLDEGADYNECTSDGKSPVLHVCSKRTITEGHIEIVKMLLDKGANYDKCDSKGISPLTGACSSGHKQIVRMLLDKGVDYNKCSNDGWSVITSACQYGHTEIVKMLLDIGADYNNCDNKSCSPVMSACKNGHTEIVRMLLDKGADYNNSDNDFCSPVMSACRYGHTEIVRMLLDKGADYNKCNINGLSPITSACRYGHTEIVRMLLDKGADYNKCNINGLSPVISACSEGHTEIVRMLLDIGADYNECNSNGWSPVMIACSKGHIEIVRMLLDIEAEYNNCNSDGLSPMIIASERGHNDIVRVINEHSRKVKGIL